jgi:signal transduction histidine kinase/DNA-binding response OmpR family regulator
MERQTLTHLATIILVDDNPANLAALTRALALHSYRVLVAQQGEQAIQIAQRVRPDLVLLDVQLPGIDGFETCRRLKADAATADIPVLFMTVLVDAEDKLKGFEAGGVDYITKPFQEAEVLARVSTHISLRQMTHNLQSQNEQLEAAQTALQVANEQLEQRVQERTADLVRANSELRAQVLERERAEDQLRASTQRLHILHTAEQRARQVAETLRTANLALSQSLDLDTILDTLLEYLGQLIPYDGTCVMVCDTSQLFRVRRIRGDIHWSHFRLTANSIIDINTCPYFRTLISTQASVLIDDTSSEVGCAAPEGAAVTRSWLGVPLLAVGDLVGIFVVAHRQPSRFTEEHRLIAESLAAQVAIAIQNARLFAEVSAAQIRLQAISRQLVAVQEAERAQIARDLHDEIGQMLTGLKLLLAISGRSTLDEVRLRLVEAQELVNDLTIRVRELSLDLRPAMLDDLGLLPTLLWYIKRYTAQTEVNVALKHTGLEQRVAPEIEIAIYRIVQEGLTNVARHAGVRDVAVWLWRTEDSIGARIEDRGRGFVPEPIIGAHTTSGLAGMAERARLLGGQLTIETSHHQGTRLTVDLPLGAVLEQRE